MYILCTWLAADMWTHQKSKTFNKVNIVYFVFYLCYEELYFLYCISWFIITLQIEVFLNSWRLFLNWKRKGNETRCVTSLSRTKNNLLHVFSNSWHYKNNLLVFLIIVYGDSQMQYKNGNILLQTIKCQYKNIFQ